MKIIFSILMGLMSNMSVFAQMPANGLDVKHYTFYIDLNDSNNHIMGTALITTGFTKNVKRVKLDLVNKNKEGKGMMVTSVLKNGIDLDYRAEYATRGNF